MRVNAKYDMSTRVLLMTDGGHSSLGVAALRQGGMSQEATRRQVEAETAEAAPPPLPPVSAPDASFSVLV